MNHRNRKQPRIFGIDQYRIYNLLPKQQQAPAYNSLFTTMKESLFGVKKTKNPERLMDDVISVKICRPTLFMINVVDFDKTTKKTLIFQVEDPAIPKRIRAKINHIK